MNVGSHLVYAAKPSGKAESFARAASVHPTDSLFLVRPKSTEFDYSCKNLMPRCQG